MANPQRTYLVRHRSGLGSDRLIKAPNAAQALRHVVADIFAVSVASQDNLERLLPAGVRVERSGDAALVDAALANETPTTESA